MIKLEHNSTDKGFIVEEINDKLIKKGEVKPLEAEKVENNPESVEKHIELAKKKAEDEIKEIEKVALTTKSEDRAVFAESIKFKNRAELSSFLSKLREQKIRRRVVPIKEDAEGFRFEVQYERPLVENLTEEIKLGSLEDLANLKVGDTLNVTADDVEIFKKALEMKKQYESLSEAKDEPKLETFDEQMDFLAKDEQEAIDGYEKVLGLVKDEHVKEQLDKILVEEKAHKAFLEAVKSDKSLEYTHEEHEEESEEDEEEIKVEPNKDEIVINKEWDFEEEDKLAEEMINKESLIESYTPTADDDDISSFQNLSFEDDKEAENLSKMPMNDMWDFGDEE